MTRLEKAKAQLKGCGVETRTENDTLYVFAGSGDLLLELADFEINFRAKLYDEEQKEEE